MTVNLRQLTALSYGNGFTLWHYRCHDGEPERDGAATLAEVRAPGFFDDAERLADGDIILVSASDGGAGYFVVTMGGEVQLRPLAGN